MKRTAVLPLLLLLVLLFSLFFINLTGIPIVIWDEARLANNALEMHLNGNWIVTFYDGSPDLYNTKPPLLIWLQVICMKLFGINEFAVRLPSALASVATGVLIWWFVKKRLQNAWIGFLAGSVFATTYAYVFLHAGRSGDYDALLTLWTTSFCVSLYIFVTEKKVKWLYCFWTFLTLAVLTKSVAGLLFLPGLFLFILFQKSLRDFLFNKHFYLGAAGFLVLAGGYYLLRERMNPGYLKAVWENELGGRFGTALEGHNHPFGYYFRNMHKWRNEYWFYFILPSFAVGFVVNNKEVVKVSLFNLLMVVPFFLLISKAQTKLQWYDIPLYPFLSMQTGILLFVIWSSVENLVMKKKFRSLVALAAFSLAFFFPFQQCWNFIYYFGRAPHQNDPQQGYYLQHAVRTKKDLNGYVFCYSDYNAPIKFYIEALRHKGVAVDLENSVENLQPGKKVVVSEKALKEAISKQYVLQKREEAFGCTVYLVQQRL